MIIYILQYQNMASPIGIEAATQITGNLGKTIKYMSLGSPVPYI